MVAGSSFARLSAMTVQRARPRIGVTSASGSQPDDYLEVLEEAGAEAIVLANRPNMITSDLSSLDGILLSGGEDVDPAHYGAEPHPKTVLAEPERDLYEIGLAREAHRRNVPILAICRGLQVFNVALGGTLVQHIPDAISGSIRHKVSRRLGTVEGHEVRISASSRLATILGTTCVQTTSRHHQSVADVAPSLICVARTDDGIIEALEGPAARFMIAVQWHPESMMNAGETSKRLFAAFVESAAAMRAEHNSPRRTL